MKLAFSTLGCPGWSFNEIYATAKDLGMDGVEIRGIGREIYAPHAKEFSDENLDQTMETLRKNGITIPIFTSGAELGLAEKKEEALQEAYDYVDLAFKAGVPYIRVLGTANPAPEDSDLNLALEQYCKVCDYAAAKNVTPLMETNGLLADSMVMAEFMAKASRPNSGVLWDIHHPYRFFGEPPMATYKNIGEYVRYVHVKDSVLDENDKVSYRMMGYGDVPIFDCLKVLSDNGYTSFIALEWIKRWNPELQEPGIVLSHFVNYMHYLIDQL